MKKDDNGVNEKYDAYLMLIFSPEKMVLTKIIFSKGSAYVWFLLSLYYSNAMKTFFLLLLTVLMTSYMKDQEISGLSSDDLKWELYVVTQTVLQQCKDCGDVEAVVKNTFFRTKDNYLQNKWT